MTVAALATAWHAFLVSDAPVTPDCAYWAQSRLPGGWQVEMAGTQAMHDWQDWAERLLGLGAPAQQMGDPARGLHRMAFHRDGRLAAALFVGPQPVALSRSHLAAMLGGALTGALAGRPRSDMPDPGPTVCACLGVGLNTIRQAVARGCDSVASLGAVTGAGTNCGSCRPELSALLRPVPMQAAE